MRAVALLGPTADAKHVAPFAAAGRTAISTATAIGSADVALILGGDGTIHRHLKTLVAAAIPALIVPMGSGNDFARALGLNTFERSVLAWRQFCTTRQNVRTIDVGKITPAGNQRPDDNLFCCVAGAGIDADINRRANLLPRWLRGHGGYALSVVSGAFEFLPQRISVDFEDAAGNAGAISEPALMCAFANANSYGHGMRIAPNAQLDDGLLDLVFVRKASRARLLTVFPKVYFGAHMTLPEVEHRPVRRLKITSETPLDIYADGEFICQTPAEVTVSPQALKVICNHQ